MSSLRCGSRDRGQCMSSFEERRNSAANMQHRVPGLLRLPGLVNQPPPVEQLPFPDYTSPPVGATRPSETPAGPAVTQKLSDPGSFSAETGPLNSSPGITRKLSDLQSPQTEALPFVKSNTTALRQPIVIRGSGKKRPETIRPPKSPKGRRWVVQLAVTAVVALALFGTLMAVLPTGSEGHGGINPFQSVLNLVHSGNNTSSIAQQAATATAVTQDGYDAGGGHTYAGLPTPPPGSTSGDNFTYGQCTYYADMRYHQLTGYWVPWGGNASQWAYGAAHSSGWIVSSTPHVPSIIVLQSYVQGASYYGHVAVVESINADGSVHTSNWNWYANGGGWATLSYWDFYPGSGVSFVWYPGK